jgi:myo-inositol-1(or 4)-monophosphatase
MIAPFELEKIISKTQDAAYCAGDILLKHLSVKPVIRFKGQYNMCTDADLESESFLIQRLSEIAPGIPVISEEDYESRMTEILHTKTWKWLVDPLDGTTNFAHKVPHFCVSIALVNEQNKPQLAVVFDPSRKELFSATIGGGTFLNGARCSVSTSPDLEHSLVATGFPYKIRELKKNNLIEFCAMRLRVQGVRRIGAAALDLAYVASGRLDGFWERWLKPWDTAAGILLITEAGGRISLFNGSNYELHEAEILASNSLVHQEMMSILNRDWPELPVELYS